MNQALTMILTFCVTSVAVAANLEVKLKNPVQTKCGVMAGMSLTNSENEAIAGLQAIEQIKESIGKFETDTQEQVRLVGSQVNVNVLDASYRITIPPAKSRGVREFRCTMDFKLDEKWCTLVSGKFKYCTEVQPMAEVEKEGFGKNFLKVLGVIRWKPLPPPASEEETATTR